MLEARDIVVERSRRRLLDGVAVTVRPGEVLVVCGPNGAGKTTLLSVLAGDIDPDEGSVHLNGADIRGYSATALACRRAVVEQRPAIAPGFLVRDIVALGTACAPRDLPPGALADLIGRSLESVGITQMASRPMQALSGGERARVHMARALAQIGVCGLVQDAGHSSAAPILMLDEPTAALDLRHQRHFVDLVRRIAADGVGVLAIVHDLNLAAAIATGVLLLDQGQVAAEGDPEAVLCHEVLEPVYGVPFQVLPTGDKGRTIITSFGR